MDKLLVIVNAFAGTVSSRTKEVIAKALAADFKLEIVETASRNHASELARDGVDRDFDAIVAFGGDGTINEVAQGVVGTDVALGIIPGGTTNVMARTLGVPVDPVEATAFVAERLRSKTKRRIGVGRAGDRHFIASCGFGLDAEVIRRMELDPDRKRRWGDWAWVSQAVGAAMTQYRAADPEITLEAPERDPERVVLAVCCNLRPFTYFKRWPVDVCPGAGLDGALDAFALKRIRVTTVPRIVSALFVTRAHMKWKNAVYLHQVTELTLRADRELPAQVDGDYIGERREMRIEYRPDELDLLV